MDWFRYIFQNRRVRDTLSADVIIGPISNDTIFDTLGIISSGFLSESEAMKLLMIGPEYTQVVLKTPKAAEQLRWLRSETITKPDAEHWRAERDAYAVALAKAVQEITGEEGG